MSGIINKTWLTFAILTVSLIVTASVFWIIDHPFGISWDEAGYFNQMQSDLVHFKADGLRGLVRALSFEDRGRPPAYRLFIIPFTYLLGFSPVMVRMVSIAALLASLLFVYLGARSIAGPKSGAFAVIFLCLCGDLLHSIAFGTEYPLYLATAATLCFLFLNWDKRQEFQRNWIGLGISLGLGALSKASFILIGGPALLLSFVLSWRKLIVSPSPKFLMKACTLGVLIALPWWLLNFLPALEYAGYATNFFRHSMGPPGLMLWAHWLSAFAQSSLGLPLAILSISMLITLIPCIINKGSCEITVAQKAAVAVCLLSPLALMIAPMFGKNQNLGHISPSVIFLAVGFGVLAETTQWTSNRIRAAIASILFLVQLGLIIIPAFRPSILDIKSPSRLRYPWLVMARWEQWDWNQLRELTRSYGIENPSISYLGNGSAYNPPQIEYPWIIHNEKVRVKWLWRYEDGPIDIDRIMKSIIDSDIVLTAPHYIGALRDKQDLDNQYNNEFVRRLGSDPSFKGPFNIRMGIFEPVDIVVFFNSRCFHLTPNY